MDRLGICNHNKSERPTKNAAKTFLLRQPLRSFLILIQTTLTHLERKTFQGGIAHSWNQINHRPFHFPTFQWDFFLQGIFSYVKNPWKKGPLFRNLRPTCMRSSICLTTWGLWRFLSQTISLLRGMGWTCSTSGKDHWVTCSKFWAWVLPNEVQSEGQVQFPRDRRLEIPSFCQVFQHLLAWAVFCFQKQSFNSLLDIYWMIHEHMAGVMSYHFKLNYTRWYHIKAPFKVKLLTRLHLHSFWSCHNILVNMSEPPMESE